MLFYINICKICLSVVRFIFADALIRMWLLHTLFNREQSTIAESHNFACFNCRVEAQ